MSILTVDFELPQEILDGLLSGEYTRCGGVIRDGAGQIVKHLVETGQYIEVNNISVMQQMKALKLLGNLSLTTNLLTLGVVSVGFLVMNQKLIKMEKQLCDIKNGLKEIERKIDFIQDQLDVKLLAKLKAAINIGEAALLSKEDKKIRFLDAQNRFIEVKHEMHGLAEKIRGRYGIVSFYDIYAHYGACYAIAAMGEAKCALYLDEHEIAIKNIRESANDINVMRRYYQESFNPRRIEVQQITHAEIPRVKQYSDEFDEMRKRIESAEAQINLLLRTGTSYMDLEKMCSSKVASGPIAYVTERG